MKKLLTTLVSTALLATAGFADTLTQRIQASYLIAFGRGANSGEITYWKQQNPGSVADLVNGHRQFLTRDANTHREMIKRSYIDALGRNPNDGEIQHWMGGNDTYSQLMKNHISWLGGNPGEYEAVIKRSYRLALNRQPSAAEIQYWRSQGTLSYAMLVAAHDTWRRSNGSAAKTSGTATVASDSSYLASVVVSRGIAAEVRATGLIGNDGSTLVAAGGGNMVAAGGGNLIGNDGSTLVGNDGASMVAAGGGNLVAAGGGN